MQLVNKESIATGLVRPKTTALFFDKLWVPQIADCFTNIPDDIFLKDINQSRHLEFSMRYWRGICNNQRWDLIEKDILERIISKDDFPEDFLLSSNRNAALLEIAESFRTDLNMEIVPIFIEKTAFENSLSWLNDPPFEEQMNIYSVKGMEEKYYNEQFEMLYNRKTHVLEVCIKNIPNTVEEELCWEQVLELRRDKSSLNSLRRFKRWLNAELVGKSENEIIETIEKNLDDYIFAMKKHGILTTIGSLTTMITSSASIINSLIDSPLEIISTGFVVSASIFTFTAQEISEYIEKKREPIAFFYEINKLI